MENIEAIKKEGLAMWSGLLLLYPSLVLYLGLLLVPKPPPRLVLVVELGGMIITTLLQGKKVPESLSLSVSPATY